MSKPSAPSKSQIRNLLLRYDALRDAGHSHKESADRLEVSASRLKRWKDAETDLFSVPGPWENVHEGYRWTDMPGSCDLTKRCNFYLFRKGELVIRDGAFVNRLSRMGRSKGGRPPAKAGRVKPDAQAFNLDLTAFIE